MSAPEIRQTSRPSKSIVIFDGLAGRVRLASNMPVNIRKNIELFVPARDAKCTCAKQSAGEDAF